ncbi:dnaJ homolog subfamily C member 4-like [Leptopilina heterotoma]|uniref:dnaJ homolog subfamily C member 4-like n=1 Tax=Leptopilina heterotoma TaxID=63436 RepID=UPI001CA837A7|nr:dnaJ homolog subfamily C member 4-like [Leptopilina heterotoma]
MNQIFRFCKIDPFVISRHYGNQGKTTTHYETLRVPETASQKDIKEAFIKLSKEMHPDIKGNKSHEDFVKINEAYNVLSKEIPKRDYDTNLKYGYSPNFSSHYAYGYRPQSSDFYYRPPHFRSKAEYDQYRNSQAEEKDESTKRKRRINNLFIAFVCLVVTTISGIIQVIRVNKTLLDREEIFAKRTLRFTNELNEIEENVRSKTKEQKLQDFRKKIELAKKDE